MSADGSLRAESRRGIVCTDDRAPIPLRSLLFTIGEKVREILDQPSTRPRVVSPTAAPGAECRPAPRQPDVGSSVIS